MEFDADLVDTVLKTYDPDISRILEESLNKIFEKIKKIQHKNFTVEYVGNSNIETFLVRFGSFSEIKVKYMLFMDGTETFVWQIGSRDLNYGRIVPDELKSIVRMEVARYIRSLETMV